MILDIALLVIFLFSAYNGYKKGLMVSTIGFVSYIVCFFIAFFFNAKFTAVLSEIELLKNILLVMPILSFVILFFITNKLVYFIANMLKKINKLLFLGFFDKLGGAILSVSLSIIVVSFVAFYARKIGIISDSWADQSILINNLIEFGSNISTLLVDNFDFIKTYFKSLLELMDVKQLKKAPL